MRLFSRNKCNLTNTYTYMYVHRRTILNEIKRKLKARRKLKQSNE